MRNETNEYSMADCSTIRGSAGLARAGIERRCLDLMLDARSRDRRYAEAETRMVISTSTRRNEIRS